MRLKSDFQIKTKHLSILLLMICLFFGCNSNSDKKQSLDSEKKNGKIKVLSTTSMIENLVTLIGKEHINSQILIRGEIDPHSYELVKGDDEKLSQATIIFCNGLGLEHGASLHYQLQHHPYAIHLGNEIQKAFPEKMILIDKQLDPHIWMDISLWSNAIDPIVTALSEKDPQNRESYKKNGEELRTQMLKVHNQIRTQMMQIPMHKRFLVTSHDAFNYFTRSYLAEDLDEWQKHCAAPEGLAPDGQLSLKDIQRIVNYVSENRVMVVFPESNVSKDSLKKIVSSCKAKGLSITLSKEPLYGDAIGSLGSSADSYLKMIHHNASILIKSWNNEP